MIKHPQLTRMSCLLFALCSGSLYSTAEASVYSVSDDFSTVSNPNGVWTYGWLDSLGGNFTAYSEYSPASASWKDLGTNYYLSLWNGGFHPGPQNQLSDYRFTAPTAVAYNLDFKFQGADVYGTTSDVHINAGSTSLFSELINGYGASSEQNFSGLVFLNAGQTLDIAVGYGQNSTYFNDSTALQGTISAVPVPASYMLFVSGLGIAKLVTRRRKISA